MLNAKKMRQVFARHKRATALWIISLIYFGLLAAGNFHRINPFGFAYGESMWPTWSHFNFYIVDRWFTPAYKIQVNDIVAFQICKRYENWETYEGHTADCGTMSLDRSVYFKKCDKPDLEKCNLTWMDYLTGEVVHRILRKNCYALDVNEEVLRYEELDHEEGDIMWWYDNVKECKTTLRTGEEIFGCNDTFEKIDGSKIECIFTQKGDCKDCIWDSVFTSEFYRGKIIWVFSFPI